MSIIKTLEAQLEAFESEAKDEIKRFLAYVGLRASAEVGGETAVPTDPAPVPGPADPVADPAPVAADPAPVDPAPADPAPV